MPSWAGLKTRFVALWVIEDVCSFHNVAVIFVNVIKKKKLANDGKKQLIVVYEFVFSAAHEGFPLPKNSYSEDKKNAPKVAVTNSEFK